jgi:hypothetical protein
LDNKVEAEVKAKTALTVRRSLASTSTLTCFATELRNPFPYLKELIGVMPITLDKEAILD